LFALCAGQVGVDGGADDERGDEEVAETTEACGTGTLPLQHAGSFLVVLTEQHLGQMMKTERLVMLIIN
jgi:hypothetical protein